MPLFPGLFLALALFAPGASAQTAAAPAATGTPVNLISHPERLVPVDRRLLQAAGYLFPEDGTIRDPNEKTLDEATLRAALEKLRSLTLEQTLAGLERVQDAYTRNDGRLNGEQVLQLQSLLRHGGTLIPAELLVGFNKMLAYNGAQPVTDLIRDGTRSWQASGADDSSVSGRGNVGGASSSLRPSTRFHDEFSPVSPDVAAARIAEINQAAWRDPKTGETGPYAENVRAVLREVVRDADAADGKAVLDVLRQMHPPIAISNAAVPPFESGSALDERGRLAAIALQEYGVSYKKDQTSDEIDLPHSDASFYKEQLGVRAPALAAFDPAAKPDSTQAQWHMSVERFSDGSVRYRPDAGGLAPTLLHELMHLHTALLGGGAHNFSDEMSALAAQNRLIFNRDERGGFARNPLYAKSFDWLSRPLEYRRKVLAMYSSAEAGEVRPGEDTVDGQIKQELLAGGDEAAWKAKKIGEAAASARDAKMAAVEVLEKNGLASEADVKAARKTIADAADAELLAKLAEPFDARKDFEDEMSRLRKDRELTLKDFLQDWRWHEERGVGYGGMENNVPARP